MTANLCAATHEAKRRPADIGYHPEGRRAEHACAGNRRLGHKTPHKCVCSYTWSTPEQYQRQRISALYAERGSEPRPEVLAPMVVFRAEHHTIALAAGVAYPPEKASPATGGEGPADGSTQHSPPPGGSRWRPF